MRIDPVGPDATPERSADPCPVCGHHDLTLDLPPHLSVAGVQPYTDLYAMGDLPMPAGVHCASCGTRWVSIEALRAGEPSPPEAEPPPDLVVEEDTPVGAAAPAADLPAGEARTASRGPDAIETITLVVAVVAGILLLATDLIWLVMIPVIAVVLLVRRRRSRDPGR